MEKIIYSGIWKLDKILFDRPKNNAAIGVDYLKKKKKIVIQFFISKRPACLEKYPK